MKKIIRFIIRLSFIYDIRRLFKKYVPKNKLPKYFSNKINFEKKDVYESYVKNLIINYKPSDKFIIENLNKYLLYFLQSKWINFKIIKSIFSSDIEIIGKNYCLTNCIIDTLSSGNYKCLKDVLKLYFPTLEPMYNLDSITWKNICGRETILRYITVEDLIKYSERIEWNLIFSLKILSLRDLKKLDKNIPNLLSNNYNNIVKYQPEIVFNKEYQDFVLNKVHNKKLNINREAFIKLKNIYYESYNFKLGYFILYKYKRDIYCSGLFSYNFLINCGKVGMNNYYKEEDINNKIMKFAVNIKDFISTGKIDEEKTLLLREFNKEGVNFVKRC